MNKKYVIERIVRIQWMFMNVPDENVINSNEYSWILQLIYMNWNFVLKIHIFKSISKAKLLLLN